MTAPAPMDRIARARDARVRRLPGAAVALMALAIFVAACSGGAAGSASPVGSATASPFASAPPSAAAGGSNPPSAPASLAPSPAPSSPVVGVVTAVKSAGLTQVESFTIRTAEGEQLTFAVGKLAPGSFPAGHLTEHAATGEPIQVTFVVDGDRLVTTALADAP